MFEKTIKDIKNSEDYKENLENLAKTRFYFELPNSYQNLIHILVQDPSGAELLKQIKKHMDEETTAGKVSLEKRDSDENVVTVHMYEKEEQLSEVTVSPEMHEISTDYKVGRETFDELKNISTNYQEKMAEIEIDIKEKNTY